MTPSLLSPQDLQKQAQLAYDSEAFKQAADLFSEAADGFRATNDAVNAAECGNNCSVALLRAGDPTGALKAASGTEEVFAQANDRRRQAMALGNQAAALEELKEYQASLERYRKSADILKELNDTELLSYVLKRISALQARLGKRLESIAAMDAALHIKPKLTIKESFMKFLFDLLFKLMNRPPMPF
jgi:tetratricopeptide (TPR) repeat protein